VLSAKEFNCFFTAKLTVFSLQVGNRSSEFHPDVHRVRRKGSYIYEEFLPTGQWSRQYCTVLYHTVEYCNVP